MIRGLELVVFGKQESFEVDYIDGKYLRQGAKKGKDNAEVEDLLDIICQSCGTAYYTTESDAIEFCAHCGVFDRRRIESFQELMQWAREQDWGFLRWVPGYKVFAVQRETHWSPRLARSLEELEMRGGFTDVKPLQV